MNLDLVPICFICHQAPGHPKGIVLKGHYICRRCEEKMVLSDVNDTEYFFYKDKIKIALGLNYSSD